MILPPVVQSISPFEPHNVEAAVDLISRSMNPEEGEYARRTFSQYFDSRRHGIDDGRELFVMKDEERVVGITGLHFYNWGPPQNVWLSWFAVDPAIHGKGLGSRLMAATIEAAKSKGFNKLLIETYSSDTFATARKFYDAKGFVKMGGIDSYMPDGADMVIYVKSL